MGRARGSVQLPRQGGRSGAGFDTAFGYAPDAPLPQQAASAFRLRKGYGVRGCLRRLHQRKHPGAGGRLQGEPVREAIHSSFVSTNLDKSLFVSTIFGTAEPTPCAAKGGAKGRSCQRQRDASYEPSCQALAVRARARNEPRSVPSCGYAIARAAQQGGRGGSQKVHCQAIRVRLDTGDAPASLAPAGHAAAEAVTASFWRVGPAAQRRRGARAARKAVAAETGLAAATAGVKRVAVPAPAALQQTGTPSAAMAGWSSDNEATARAEPGLKPALLGAAAVPLAPHFEATASEEERAGTGASLPRVRGAARRATTGRKR